MIEIRNGTPRSDRDLCTTCEHMLRMRDEDGTVTRRCNMGMGNVKRVVECTGYEGRTSVPLLYKTAWLYGRRYKGNNEWEEDRHFHPPGVSTTSG